MTATMQPSPDTDNVLGIRSGQSTLTSLLFNELCSGQKKISFRILVKFFAGHLSSRESFGNPVENGLPRPIHHSLGTSVAYKLACTCGQDGALQSRVLQGGVRR
ncbi:hypothetical protein GOP47_0023315 [Adiantum capillus-veneris]|uniref:Uncharacterized protein n=1 Tax=Adiantum capillus-veneris TaxID=13818 RepID=A0A9D4U9D6_ADICA|nr:hypothetical protein GOP47_0023315 [Adiantum capillus-veneris]